MAFPFHGMTFRIHVMAFHPGALKPRLGKALPAAEMR
jgi:hypothetical protein